ncbi:hypothetical protein BZG36_05119 [Bifiguratus adelaidae]|uniref:superoxide dismutase n=1 Tax=Bifiguratus adelaidae TaxID=1938954 RepID=A0A261XTP5_9FUNG|nr:hypothetical protein BZG36_05119 [Bifiguratus adelaidae]
MGSIEQTITLIRHGEAQHNVHPPETHDIPDPHLTPRGREQCERLRVELAAKDVLTQEFPELDFSRCAKDPIFPRKEGIYAADLSALQQRAQFARQILRERPERRIAVVCHGAFIRFLQGLDPTNYRTLTADQVFGNCEWRTYRFEADQLVEVEASRTAGDKVTVQEEWQHVQAPLLISMTRKTIYLIRHGEAEHNVNFPASHSIHDPHLTVKGREQCVQLQEKLRKEGYAFDLICVSVLRRALETLQIGLAEQLVPLEGKVNNVLVMPELQGITDAPCDTSVSLSELQREFPRLDFSRCATDQDWPTKVGKYNPQEFHLKARALAVRQFVAERQESHIAIVGHEGFIRFLLGIDTLDYTQLTPQHIFGNCEVRQFTFDSADPSLGAQVRHKVTLPDLPYDYNALEPSISGEIMKLHHTKHHQTYVTNYNAAEEKLAAAVKNSDLREQIALQAAIKFNGGGHLNHSIFWTNLAPKSQGGGEAPKGALATAINEQWGSLEAFKEKFNAALAGIQGSGWAWLGYNKQTKALEIVTTANQDPLIHLTPVLGIDAWEHAYYLQYKNAKAEYFKAIWDVINWKNVAERYAKAQ